ncbi:dolichyldiphosphatase [Xylona heveae TC161]|uniref:Dolichyldiphosphatase n=1 Tax=Xylona heveae (strain CBS 132557 / TC161) TaxID=1328760 RepID=A0A165FU00_XYLHT|nr:dolichyldiphosphatase [Xylona heveae TC161]KZF21377.1 dolichyldiphosphatase [Xylona heveae TC161]
MEGPPLASLSLTHVHYNPDDPISYICAWLALVPQGLCVAYATLIWSTREVEILLMFAGQLACEALNWGLKRYIKEERPSQMNGKGYGMPSSHAQFVTFFSMSLTFFLLFRHVPNPGSSSSSSSFSHGPASPSSASSFAERALLSLLALVSAAAVAASRIYLNYHTPKQVIVGCLAGVFCAIFWFLFTSYLRQAGWIDWALDLQWAKMARMRDLIVNEDLVDAGWDKWQTKRRRKLKLRDDWTGKSL